ncbi:prepilin-type cleavage/methylation domain-containing protein [cf. Phormidesmis sp. LEGE 11477]|nr:prepilin-type cleavage/methylation domain-containing protein [cf. Phormidesmis sp. LEGE 11477]
MELLIAMVISSIVTSGLLYLVVEIMQVDRREASLDQVQRDMQRAINYIGDDLQEALYVYSNPTRIAALATSLENDPQFPDAGGDTPVLAFWRVDPIENNLPDCTSYAAGTPALRQCESLRIRQASYTLVVYVQRVNDGNANWPGQSRLIRYELSKYTNTATMAVRNGYRDPADLEDGASTFEDWTPATGEVPAGTSAVLVDFVNDPGATLDRSPLSDPTAACSTYGTDASGDFLYQVVPDGANITTNTSFFACVRNADTDTEERANQDVYVFLRGNAFDGPSGSINMSSEESALPVLETRVLVRGVINKRI